MKEKEKGCNYYIEKVKVGVVEKNYIIAMLVLFVVVLILFMFFVYYIRHVISVLEYVKSICMVDFFFFDADSCIFEQEV